MQSIDGVDKQDQCVVPIGHRLDILDNVVHAFKVEFGVHRLRYPFLPTLHEKVSPRGVVIIRSQIEQPTDDLVPFIKMGTSD